MTVDDRTHLQTVTAEVDRYLADDGPVLHVQHALESCLRLLADRSGRPAAAIRRVSAELAEVQRLRLDVERRSAAVTVLRPLRVDLEEMTAGWREPRPTGPSIDALLRDPDRRRHAAAPESDPLTEPDALLEADLLDIRHDPVSGEVRLLLDLRVSLGFRAAEVGVVRLGGVTSANVDGPAGCSPVMSSRPAVRHGGFSFGVGCLSGLRLDVLARSAEFFAGTMPGLPPAQPAFGEADDEEMAAGMPSWERPFIPLCAGFVDPAG